MKCLIFAYVITLTYADVPGVSSKPWLGPIADHQLGIHPSDTPEVAVAKAQHLKAYKDALAVLPVLLPEERYIKHDLSLPKVLALQKQAQDNFNTIQVQHVQPVIQTHPPLIQPVVLPEIVHHIPFNKQPGITQNVPTVFAEDIPRSSIGEVPEVHAARVEHLTAVQEALAALPPLVV